ncbi:MAG: type II toxin-antitoxin system RelE/ParE family toxin [Nitrospinae bacterium]|nr:type II toxin-antitoxin system RelE/ParE family toxin [Nitrospinota bacterium]
MRIRWLKAAADDLLHVEAFIARENPAAAVDVVLAVINAVEKLGRFPAMGRPGRVDDTRELVVGGFPFIVPYTVRKDVVEILRVFHQRQKWSDMDFDMESARIK